MWTQCPECGKRSFASRKKANRYARAENLRGMTTYECGRNPGAIHLGHLPDGVIAGQYARDDIRRGTLRRPA
ncbi:hypothetical protein [Tsukamurella sp. NPDC003166]|uniref:hypothetical protein n=1 Tax=Tsukamurella sp. NPDC003166 TaxID=3154444 RepID=UPI00339FBB23